MNFNQTNLVRMNRKGHEEIVGDLARRILGEDEKERRVRQLPKKRTEREYYEYRLFFDNIYDSFREKILEFESSLDNTQPGDTSNLDEYSPEKLPNIIGNAFVLPDAIARVLNTRMGGKGNVGDIVKICHMLACNIHYTRAKNANAIMYFMNTFKQLQLENLHLSQGGIASGVVMLALMQNQENRIDPNILDEIVKHTGYDIEKIVSLVFAYFIEKRNSY